jgi:tetratricopeptide (TPR) repeat protein
MTRKSVEAARSILILVLAILPLYGLALPARLRRSFAEATEATNGEKQGEQDLRLLDPGKPVEREMAGAEVHSYRIELAQGQYLRLVVNQRGIDVVVTLFAPDGQRLVEVDSPNGAQGPERLSMVVETTGSYRLEVRSLRKEATPGRYEAAIAELRVASAKDRNRIAAERAFMEGERLRTQETAASLLKAIEKYQESLPLWQAAGERRREANSLHNIGLVYNALGEKQKALDYYQQALLLKQAEGDRREEANTLNNLANVYGSLGDYERALDYLNQALLIRQAEGDQRGQASTLHNLGAIYNLSGDKQKALEHFHQALRLRETVGPRRGEANALGSIGQVYSSMGEKQKALEYYHRALQIFRVEGERIGEATTLHNLGAVSDSLGEKQKALDYYNQALALRKAIGDRQQVANTLHNIAMVYQPLGRLDEALSLAQEALDIIESLRAGIDSQELRSSYFATVQRFYDLYIDLLMQLHKQQSSKIHVAAALQASERARARSLIDLLTEARDDIRRGIDPVLLEQERLAQRRLNAKAEYQMRLLSGAHTDEQAATAEKELRESLAQYQDVEGQIRAKSPRYAALTQPRPFGLKEIQSLLEPGDLLLEYALGAERGYLWAVSPASIMSYELPNRAEVETAARRVYEMLTARHVAHGETDLQRRERVSKADAEFQTAAARLSEMLLGHVASLPNAKRLVIVADGMLQYVPFGALPAPVTVRGETERQRDGETERQRDRGTGKTRNPQSAIRNPLIVDHEIVSLPSASVLAALRQETAGRKPVAGAVAALADPVFDKDDDRVVARAKEPDGAKTKNGASNSGERSVAGDIRRAMREVEAMDGAGRIPRLPLSRQEAEAIVASAPAGSSLKAVSFKASRATAMSAELGQYRVVHFATHGLLNAEHPELSGVLLSLVDEQGRPQDGFLRLHEIYNLELPVELVVLSACQTGLGKEVKREGLVGLVRGFMYAGAPRVVASLWKVDDFATTKLMGHFYQAMLKNKTRPAEALRRAQIAMWKQKQWQAPYYWAGFVIQGEWN